MFLFLRLIVCLLGIGLGLYVTVVSDNRLTRLRMQIPKLKQEVQELEEENEALAFAIASRTEPHHLLKLSSSFEFLHLKPTFSPPLVCPVVSENASL